MGDLTAFFHPSSIAVIGASESAGKLGHEILKNLLDGGFPGAVYPINPNYDELMGLKSYPDLASLPAPPELVVIVVDLARMPEILDEMARLGCHNALIVSGGGKELGGGRAELERTIAKKARELDIRLIGPNCIGSFDGASRFDSFFHSHERLARPPAGPMSFITQSGTWGCVFLEEARITGVSKMVSYGLAYDSDDGRAAFWAESAVEHLKTGVDTVIAVGALKPAAWSEFAGKLLTGLASGEVTGRAFAAAASFAPLPDSRLEAIRRRAAEAVKGKGPCWWNC